jgi:hypothetical protein
MRGRVISVLFSLFFIAATAFADCNLGLTYTGSFRTTAYDVAPSGNDLWLATGYGLQLLDRRVGPPSLVAWIAVSDLTRYVKVRNDVAYAGSGSKVVVARRSGTKIEIVRSVDAGGTVQALAFEGTSLLVGTSAGIARFDLSDPLNPSRAAVSYVTSSPSITSIAVGTSALYVADGDSTVEVFPLLSGGVPIVGTPIPSLPRSISVAISGTNLLVSDGQATDIFILAPSGAIKATTASFGSTSQALLSGSVTFVAGQDRRIVATDLSASGSPVRLFDEELPPSAGGSVNRILSMATVPGRLYVAAGDIGLQTYDTSKFTTPFPLRAYTSEAPASLTGSDLAIYAGTSNGIVEFNRGTGTTLTLGRGWANGAQTVHATTTDGFLLTSSGATLTYWTIKSTTPTSISTTTFRTTVRQATFASGTAYVLLTDGSFWSTSVNQVTGTPVNISLGAAKPQSMARSGSGFAFVEVSEAGQTTVRYYASDNFTAQPQVATLAGAAITPVALDGKRAAVFTFRGISVVDFTSTPSVIELPGSASQLATALAISGNRVLELTSHEVVSWDITTRVLERRFALPGDTTALAVIDASLAAVGTTSGTIALAYASTNRQPSAYATVSSNTYYRKASLTEDRLLLIGTNRVDQYSLATSRSPQFITTLLAAGVIDAASSITGTFTLAANSVVSAWTPTGQLVTSATINEGSDVVPLAIHATSGAVFVSISRGCLTGGCEKKTLVYDPRTLEVKSTMTGALVDLVQVGTRAWAITDLPAELRALNLNDPVRPSIAASKPLEGSATTLTAVGGNVYTLGDRLYAYRDTDLAATGQQLDSAAVTAAFVRSSGTCAVLTRNGATELFDALSPAAWSSRGSLQLPAGVRSIVASGTKLVILTDYSIEVYSSAAPAAPARRRPTK